MQKILYTDLNSRQKENYNYAKLAAVLADYGFICHRLSDDWQGADFIAQHIDGETVLKVQLKASLVIDRKYEGKSIYIGFCNRKDGTWYLVPHDEAMLRVLCGGSAESSRSWQKNGSYTFPRLSQWMKEALAEFRLSSGS